LQCIRQQIGETLAKFIGIVPASSLGDCAKGRIHGAFSSLTGCNSPSAFLDPRRRHLHPNCPCISGIVVEIIRTIKAAAVVKWFRATRNASRASSDYEIRLETWESGSLNRLSKVTRISPDVLDNLLRALLTARQVVVVSVGGELVYRAVM
jgi:hypothetical protein